MAIVTGGGGRGRDAGLRAHGRGEVFPGLEAFIWVGILVGADVGDRGHRPAGALRSADC